MNRLIAAVVDNKRCPICHAYPGESCRLSPGDPPMHYERMTEFFVVDR